MARQHRSLASQLIYAMADFPECADILRTARLLCYHEQS